MHLLQELKSKKIDQKRIQVLEEIHYKDKIMEKRDKKSYLIQLKQSQYYITARKL
jgi:hypothetical protein